MVTLHAKSAFGPLSCEAGEGWGEGAFEGAFEAGVAKAALIRPSGTFSRKREKGLSSSTFSTSRDAS